MTDDFDRLAALLDPENAPAVHGSWHPAHRPMGEDSVELVDDDGCSLWVEPWEVAELVNRAVVAAGVTLARPAPDATLDVERLRTALEIVHGDPSDFSWHPADIAREYAALRVELEGDHG